jgi:hypothetical protein
MFREGVINLQRISAVLDEWEEPTHEEFRQGKSAWRLFNVATFALNGRIAENPTVTKQLHRVIDGGCH